MTLAITATRPGGDLPRGARPGRRSARASPPTQLRRGAARARRSTTGSARRRWPRWPRRASRRRRRRRSSSAWRAFARTSPRRPSRPSRRARRRWRPTSATARFNLASRALPGRPLRRRRDALPRSAARDDEAGAARAPRRRPGRARRRPPRARAARTCKRPKRRRAPPARRRSPTRRARSLDSFAHRSKRVAAPELQRLTHAGTEALQRAPLRRRRRPLSSRARARRRRRRDAADRAELEYDLGHALWRANDLVAAARALTAAVELAPARSRVPLHARPGALRRRRRSRRQARARSRASRSACPTPRRSAPPTSCARSPRRAAARPAASSSSCAPPAASTPTCRSRASSVSAAAPPATQRRRRRFSRATLDFFWRPAGTARAGFTVEYRFGQLAYLSEELDLYSLQEHDLTLSGAWTPTPRLTLELGVDGYVLFSGVETLHAVSGRRLDRPAHHRARAARLRDAPARAAHLQAARSIPPTTT